MIRHNLSMGGPVAIVLATGLPWSMAMAHQSPAPVSLAEQFKAQYPPVKVLGNTCADQGNALVRKREF